MTHLNSDTSTQDVLLVEDNPGDARLIIEAWKKRARQPRVHQVADGEQALEFLLRKRRYADAPRPDLILLDLNMPRLGGRETLKIIKQDEQLRTIPVVILTTSQSPEDVLESYDNQANCVLVKPADLDAFEKVVACIEEFWLGTVILPRVSTSS